jgi:Spherulation-specific family 4
VNPNDGPGNDTLDDPNYLRELPRLNERKNVMTIGYVSANYGNRTLDDVRKDVARYGSWSKYDLNYGVHGIFYNQTPSEYSYETAAYMSQIDSYARGQPGLGGNLVRYFLNMLIQIIHNPGTVPRDSRLFVDADLIVVYDSEYSNYASDLTLQTTLLQLPNQDVNGYLRQSFSYMFRGVPGNKTVGQLQDFIQNIKIGAQWLFMTDLDSFTDQGGFGLNWEAFTRAMASKN